MVRFIAGVAAALFMIAAAIFIWKAQADAVPAPVVKKATAPGDREPMTALDVDGPPQASDATREQKRFGRFDKNRDGAVGADEYLQSRRKAYAKLDVNGDGRLSFDEYAAKTIDKFKSADRDRSGLLNATEFLATRVARGKPKSTNCPSPLRAARESGGDEG
jgi:uncharacterized protein YxeA